MDNQKEHGLNRLNAVHKILISIILAVAGYFAISFSGSKELSHIVFCWDIFSVSMLILSWITFYTTPPREIRKQAKKEDSRRVVIFFLILIATCVSMLAVILLLTSQATEDLQNKAMYLGTAIACMVLSWFLVHTIFTSRYADLYYADHKTRRDSHAGGLDFPGKSKPDFVDFAYFAFTIGMTFQVSDVSVTSARMRRLVLYHGLLAFGYNATIIAVTVNIIAGLTQK